MMIIIQLVLFCLLFTLMVRLSAIGGGINALYFYPKEVQQKAFSLGLTDEKMMKRKKTVFFIPFLSVLLIALLLIIGLWNGVNGHSKLWLIPECAEIPYVQTWKQVLIKRSILTAIWLVLAFVVAGLIILIF